MCIFVCMYIFIYWLKIFYYICGPIKSSYKNIFKNLLYFFSQNMLSLIKWFIFTRLNISKISYFQKDRLESRSGHFCGMIFWWVHHRNLSYSTISFWPITGPKYWPQEIIALSLPGFTSIGFFYANASILQKEVL